MYASASVVRSGFPPLLLKPTVCVFWFAILAFFPVFLFAWATPGADFGCFAACKRALCFLVTIF